MDPGKNTEPFEISWFAVDPGILLSFDREFWFGIEGDWFNTSKPECYPAHPWIGCHSPILAANTKKLMKRVDHQHGVEVGFRLPAWDKSKWLSELSPLPLELFGKLAGYLCSCDSALLSSTTNRKSCKSTRATRFGVHTLATDFSLSLPQERVVQQAASIKWRTLEDHLKPSHGLPCFEQAMEETLVSCF